ncbi:MAG: alpha/beta fold hydrolase [Cytophagales bacterium]|nr:alpha/beta fold hydrolase [Cytophagales bacterium]
MTSAFLLVHGAWHGAWCWSRVLPLIRAAGYAAHAVTLTGVGERAHLLSNAIHLSTHINDVLGLIEAEELTNIVLVGHSYGGRVITGVADALLNAGKVKLRHLVYLDAVVPKSGESWSSTHAPDVIAARVQAAKDFGVQHGVDAFPPPDASVFGLTGDNAAWVNRRQTPQPLGVYLDGQAFDEARLAKLPRTFIDCTTPALATIQVSRERVRADASWRVVEMATGHDPMVSHPQELTDIFLTCL